jgi:hypothetical protein
MKNQQLKFETKVVLFLLCFIISPVVFAQDTLFVRDNLLSRRVLTGERKYIQFIETPDKTIIFNTFLTCKIEEMDNGRILISQAYQSSRGLDFDSSICETLTLRPLYYHATIHSRSYRERVTFLSDRIINETFFTDSTQTVVKQNMGYFNGVMTDELIGSSPLKSGVTFIFKTVNPGLRFRSYVTRVMVEEQETLKIEGQDVLCWRIRVNQEGSSDAIEWYTVQDRIQVMKKFNLGNGSTFYRVSIPAKVN